MFSNHFIKSNLFVLGNCSQSFKHHLHIFISEECLFYLTPRTNMIFTNITNFKTDFLEIKFTPFRVGENEFDFLSNKIQPIREKKLWSFHKIIIVRTTSLQEFRSFRITIILLQFRKIRSVFLVFSPTKCQVCRILFF